MFTSETKGLSHEHVGVGKMRPFYAKAAARCIARTETYQEMQNVQKGRVTDDGQEALIRRGLFGRTFGFIPNAVQSHRESFSSRRFTRTYVFGKCEYVLCISKYTWFIDIT